MQCSDKDTMDNSWMSVDGYIQPLNATVGLSKLRENGNRYWFVGENESNLLYYNQKNKHEIPNTQPEGSIEISSGKLEVFVVLTSNDGSEYLMFPSKDDSITDWLTKLKNKTALEDKSAASFERGSTSQGGILSRMRNSLRRKKKVVRTTSEDPQTASTRSPFKRPSYASSTDDTISELKSLRESIHFKSIDSQMKRKTKRSQSCPNTEYVDSNASPIPVQPEIQEVQEVQKGNKCEDKSCDTSSLICLDWVMAEGNSDNSLDKASKASNKNLQEDEESILPLRVDQSTQTTNMQPAEEVLKDALVLLARQIPNGADSTILNEYEMIKDEQLEEKSATDELPGDDEGQVTVQNYVNGVMTLQQQKLIRELEMVVCQLKCEVVNLIQGTINIPLKDDDLADWHCVEEIRYKDRIFELLREARLFDPNLPNYDSLSNTSNQFKDAYGFIHGSRESESVVFHYVCRELIQHYSSFYQEKNAQELVKFWTGYSKAKNENDDKIFFHEREIKTLVQEGIPSTCRSEVWKCFILENVEGKIFKKPNLYSKLVNKASALKSKLKSEMTEVERQIRCDLLRTMPNNENFKTLESPGVVKLSRVLHAFVAYKPKIGYLQGMNFLVGLFLLFMDEEDAFWSLCAVVDDYLKNYFDEILSGVQADQEVLKELIAEHLPALHAHLKYYCVDISTVTFNWFITVFLDAVPFETAIRIWDCFLYKGREIIFRVAIGLLKLQQRSLLQLSGYLEIMQYMKRAARVTYDIDRLFKASFDEIPKFQSNQELDEMQKKYRPDIEAKNDFRLTVKNERKRSRVSSFTVEIAAPDRSDRLDHAQIVECAVAASTDLSQPVCIPCTVRGETKLYLLDIQKKERSTLETNIDSRVLCADVVGDGTLLIGTMSWYIYAFNLDFNEEIWSIQLSDSVVDICHDSDDKVYAALADGSIAVLPDANSTGPPSGGSHIRVSGPTLAPVMCVTMVEDKVWCGYRNNVVVLETSSLEEVFSTVVSQVSRHQVARLIAGTHGVWCTIRGSSWVILIDKHNYDFLLKVDVSFDTFNESQVTVSPFQESRVTTVLPFGKELWVGLGNGQVLIFDVVDNQEGQVSSLEGSCGTLKEDSEESHDNVQENGVDASNHFVSNHEEEKSEKDKIISDSRFSIKMRVQYRVSEEAIRSLIVLREVEGPVVLSCAGTLSAEGGLSIWEKEATGTQLDSEEWMPCPIRHMMPPHDTPSSPTVPTMPTITVSPS